MKLCDMTEGVIRTTMMIMSCEKENQNNIFCHMHGINVGSCQLMQSFKKMKQNIAFLQWQHCCANVNACE